MLHAKEGDGSPELTFTQTTSQMVEQQYSVSYSMVYVMLTVTVHF